MKCLALMLCLLLCAPFLPAAARAEGAAALSPLHTEGKTLADADGNPVLLRGVNAGGWLVQESWMCLTNAPSQMEAFQVLDERFGRETRERLFAVYEDNYWHESDFDNVKALGMNVIRLPFVWWGLINEDGSLRPEGFERLDWFVDCCEERGLYVVLDLHAAPGSQNGNDHSGDISGCRLWDEERFQDMTVALWEAVAEHYRGRAAVAAYDLLNEPGGKMNATSFMQWEFFDRLYKAIREIDPDHIIMMESCWEPEGLPAPDRYGWENVMYQYHYYKWNADNDYAAQKLFTDVKLFKLNQANYPVPSFVGEFTLFQSMDAWRYALDAYSQAGVNWTIWTYKVTGSSTWGLYNVFGEKADIYNDSAEEIERKWREQGELRRNDALCQVVADALAGKAVTLPEEPAHESGMPVLALSPDTAVGKGATVTQEDDCLRLTVAKSGDPGSDANAVSFPLQEKNDVTSYSYLSFEMKDLQGSNTHRVTLRDAKGGVVSVWVDIPSVHGEWKRIDAPLSLFSGIDLSCLTEVSIGEWNSGDYLFGRVFFCQSVLDE